jgi:hypothetical protein
MHPGSEKIFFGSTFFGTIINMFDGFVKSPPGPVFVIPSKAGIHPAEGGTAFAGVTAFLTFYEIIMFIGQKMISEGD